MKIIIMDNRSLTAALLAVGLMNTGVQVQSFDISSVPIKEAPFMTDQVVTTTKEFGMSLKRKRKQP